MLFTIFCTRHDGSTITAVREEWARAVACAEDGWYTDEYRNIDVLDDTGEVIARYNADTLRAD